MISGSLKIKVPWANPWLDNTEREEILATYDSTWLSMGPRTKLFEELMQEYIGVRHAVAVSNGTSALDLALKALNVGYGDEVIVPAMTFVATVGTVLYQHATPVFVDIERETYNIDTNQVEKAITPKTKCIVYIDYGGNPADQGELQRISKEHSIPLLQDGAQSFGGVYKGEKLCKQGLISTASFHTAKLITSVEGWMIFIDNDEIASVLRMMRSQGEDPEQKYIHKVVGTNARMTDLQAAIGLKQLDKMDHILERRSQIADFYYSKLISNPKIIFPTVRENTVNAWFFVPILVENRDSLVRKLEEEGISTRIAYPMPVYEQPFFAKYRDKKRKYDCPNAKWMTERVLNLPIFHEISEEQLNYVVEHILSEVK